MARTTKTPEIRIQSNLSKILKISLFVFLFIFVTMAFYATSYIDYSHNYVALYRLLAMGLCYFYFYKLVEYVYSFTTITIKNRITGFYAFVLASVHLLLLAIATDHLNNWLINNSPGETVAIVNDCFKSKGTEYCMYSYTVDHTTYKMKYCNEPDYMRFKESDTVSIVYYSVFPVISKLKKELEL